MTTALADENDGGDDEANPYLDALRDPEVYERTVQDMVLRNAPGLFAIVQDQAHEPNAHVVAWGMSFPGHVEVISVDGRFRASLETVDRAVAHFAVDECTVRSVRVAPDLVVQAILRDPSALPPEWAPQGS
ncbi:hypothetical protein [Actinosynnema sp. NPDC020468]|uniref:hypothetical protein n=1 Tax=Actinosynnema sp. NPDC020468 TaxID=3154488 RepID=UPI0033EA352D